MKMILENLSEKLEIMFLAYLPSSLIASINFNHEISGIFHFLQVSTRFTTFFLSIQLKLAFTCLYQTAKP